MWQRKQTIYLLVVTLLMGSLTWLMPRHGLEGNLLASVAGVTALFSFITIFFFKNRQLQKSLCKLGMLLIVAWIAYFCYNYLTSRVSDVVYKMENSTIEFMDALESGNISPRTSGSMDLEVE